MKRYLDLLEPSVSNLAKSQAPQSLFEPIDYLLKIGGKRVRSVFTLAAADLFTDSWEKALSAAQAVEVFHNFTLMHDDIMDNAPVRRGKATVHKVWDMNTAILSGDAMLIKAYELLGELESGILPLVLRRFNMVATEVCMGQRLDLDFVKQESISKEGYLKMIELKTSVLLGFAMEVGGYVAHASSENIHHLYQSGLHFGLAFQLKDDLLDIFGEPDKFGKQTGGDIVENKKTWLYLDALEQARGTSAERELFKYYNIQGAEVGEKIRIVTELFVRLGVRERAELLMDSYFATAILHLEAIEVDDSRKIFFKTFFNQLNKREA